MCYVPVHDKTLFIADDVPEIREIIARVAKRLGWTTVETENGRELLDRVTLANGKSVIFLDLTMPKLNGLEALSRLKEYPNAKKIPIHFLTGGDHCYSDAAEALGKAYGLNICSTLRKPVTLGALKRILRST